MKFFYISAIILSAFLFGSCDDNTDEIGSSLIGDMDDLEITPASYQISTRSIIADSVYSRNTIGYLGKYAIRKQEHTLRAIYDTISHLGKL